MSIKPVDYQVMIPRTMEVSKSSSDENQKNFTMQQQQAASTQSNVENTLKQVYSQKRAQDARITERQKEENSGGKSQKKKKEKDGGGNGDGKAQKKGLQTSTIDIKI